MEKANRILLLPIVIISLLTTAITTVQAQPSHQFSLPEISCVATQLPITFSWIDFGQEPKKVPDVVLKKIQSIIVDFYLDTGGDSTEQYTKSKDGYFNTLRVPYGDLQLYIVILKTPLSYTHCKLFLYDPASKRVSQNVVDYNIWAMYGIDDNGSMKRSSLYKQLQLNSDDIAVKKKSNLFLRRIKHNGTTSDLEEITLKVNGLALDTVSYRSKPLH